MAKKYYVDLNRKYDGIVTEWSECMQLRGQISGLNFKAFPSLAEAENFLRTGDTSSHNPVTQKEDYKSVHIELLQGLVRYHQKAPKADQEEYQLNNIRPDLLSKIENFTLSIPEKENILAVCRKIPDCGNLKKRAYICEGKDGIVLKYAGNNTSNLEVSDQPVGYLEINLFGKQYFYEYSVKAVPDYTDFDGTVAFVDGSSFNKGKEDDTTNSIIYNGNIYLPYGGAYTFFRNGETEPYILSSKEEGTPIKDGLKGISKKVGNAFGEINSAIMAIKKADEIGVKKLKIYYDCSQVGGNAPGGEFKEASKSITKKYKNFWETHKFQNLEYIEFVHLDAHTTYKLNENVDELAKEMRDAVFLEFEEDEAKKREYLDHRKDYLE